MTSVSSRVESILKSLNKRLPKPGAEWMEQGKVSCIDIGFPAEVINSLQVLGPRSWDLIYATIEKLVKENRLETGDRGSRTLNE